MVFLSITIAVILLAAFPAVRCAVCHPGLVTFYSLHDLRDLFRYKKFNNFKCGDLDIYCGYFGAGKTLSLVHKVVGIYNHFNDLPVWDSERGKFVKQRILVLSNVDLAIPFVHLDSLSQVVAASKINKQYDSEHDTLTCTVVCMDELSVQLNSRSFKDNIDAYFLNTLLCCRHYHISFYGSAQRFQHVDKLMRDVTRNVIQCKKVWRFQILSVYDAWQLENATSPEMIRPLARSCWFVRNRDFAAYDTLAVVDNLQKKYKEGDILTQAEILANQSPADPNPEIVSNPSRKFKRRLKGKV